MNDKISAPIILMMQGLSAHDVCLLPRLPQREDSGDHAMVREAYAPRQQNALDQGSSRRFLPTN